MHLRKTTMHAHRHMRISYWRLWKPIIFVKTFCAEVLLQKWLVRKWRKPFVPCARHQKSQNNQPGFAETHGKHMKTQATTHPRGRRPLGGAAEGGAWLLLVFSFVFHVFRQILVDYFGFLGGVRRVQKVFSIFWPAIFAIIPQYERFSPKISVFTTFSMNCM